MTPDPSGHTPDSLSDWLLSILKKYPDYEDQCKRIEGMATQEPPFPTFHLFLDDIDSDLVTVLLSQEDDSLAYIVSDALLRLFQYVCPNISSIAFLQYLPIELGFREPRRSNESVGGELHANPEHLQELKKRWDRACSQGRRNQHLPSSKYRSLILNYPDTIREELSHHVGEVISEKPVIVIAHSIDKQIKLATIERTADKAQRSGFRWEVRYHDIILDAIPGKTINVIYDPLEKIHRYQFDLVTRQGESIRFGPALFADIVKELQKSAMTYKPRNLHDYLGPLVRAYISEGRAFIRSEIDKEGFFWLNGQLVSSRIDIRRITREQVREAATFIDEVRSFFYRSDEDTRKLAHMITLATVAPFSFARKQNGSSAKFGWVPGADLNGRSQVGKSNGLGGHILLGLWGRNNAGYHFSYGSASTPARLVNIIGKTTFPIRIDEADPLEDWSKDKTAKEIISLLKNTIENIDPRNVLTQERKEVKPLALSTPVITHNGAMPDDEGYLSRFSNLHFTKADDKSLAEKGSYDAYMREHIYKYEHLGHFIADYVLRNPGVLFDFWSGMGKKILQAFYEFADLPYPQWLDLTLENTNLREVTEDRFEDIRAAFTNYVNDTFNKYSRDVAIAARIGDGKTLDLIAKLQALIECNLTPYFKFSHDNSLCILTSVKQLLQNRNQSRLSLKELSDMIDFEYTLVKIDGKPVRCGKGTLWSFQKLLLPEISATAIN